MRVTMILIGNYIQSLHHGRVLFLTISQNEAKIFRPIDIQVSLY